MGAKVSKTKTAVTTKIISDVITNNFSNNSIIVISEQIIEQVGNYGVIIGLTQKVNYTIDIQNSVSANQVANMQADIVSRIKQAADQQSQAVLDALNESKAEVDAEIENEVKNTVTQNNITTMAARVNAKQHVIQSGEHNIMRNVTQIAVGNMILSDVKKLNQSNTTLTKIDNVLEQKATVTSTNPLEVIGDIIDSAGNAVGKVLGIGALGIWAPILLFIIVVAIIYITGRGKKSNMTSPYLRPTTSLPIQ